MDREIYRRMREVESRHWWFVARREILASQIGRLALPPGSRILEVGCGTGGNLAMLSRFGEVTAIEPDDEAQRYACESSGLKVKGGFLPDRLPPLDGPFDLIAAFDVIEHVDEDRQSVAALCDLLKPGGRMITTVPAYQWLWSRHDVQHHHKRRYTLAGFQEIFDTAGLKVRKASYFNTLLFPAIVAMRSWHKLAGVDHGDDDAMPGAGLNGALKRIFAVEKHILRYGSLPFGVSILLVAEHA